MSFSQEKVIIIGAGIVGLMTALELLDRGYHVEIFDQQEAAKAASWAGGGILSPMYPWKYLPAVNQLAQYGKASYLKWNERLMPITGIDFEIQHTGMLIFDTDQFEKGLNYHQQFNEAQQQSQMLTGHALHQCNTRLNPNLETALYFPHLANIRNPRLTQSVIAYVMQHSHARLHPHTPIRQFKKNQGKVEAIIDHQGQSHHADHYVIAAGAWSETLLQHFGISLQIQPVHGQMVLYKTPVAWLNTMCMNNTMYLIPRRDGHIVCGSSTHHFGFDTRLDPQISHNIIENALSLVPELAQFPIVKQWAGLRPGSPDGIPHIGQIPEYQNIWLNVGHYRNGLVMAPASARLLSDQIQQIPSFVDPQPYLL